MTHFKPKIITGFAAISLAWILAACAGGSRVTPEAAPLEDVELKTDGATAETFTTVGKPTKTIETPWGTLEIYDPTQDQRVFEAFERIYERSFIESIGSAKKLSSEEDYLVLNQALTSRRASIDSNICPVITESQCGVQFKYHEPSKAWAKYEVNGRNICMFGGTQVYNRDLHPMGKDFFQAYDKRYDRHLHPELNTTQFGLNEQFTNFFQFNCSHR